MLAVLFVVGRIDAFCRGFCINFERKYIFSLNLSKFHSHLFLIYFVGDWSKIFYFIDYSSKNIHWNSWINWLSFVYFFVSNESIS